MWVTPGHLSPITWCSLLSGFCIFHGSCKNELAWRWGHHLIGPTGLAMGLYLYAVECAQAESNEKMPESWGVILWPMRSQRNVNRQVQFHCSSSRDSELGDLKNKLEPEGEIIRKDRNKWKSKQKTHQDKRDYEGIGKIRHGCLVVVVTIWFSDKLDIFQRRDRLISWQDWDLVSCLEYQLHTSSPRVSSGTSLRFTQSGVFHTCFSHVYMSGFVP